MQSCIILKGVCDDIDKICRGFIWEEEIGQRKFHPIRWEKICQPKKEEGLGLRSMRDINSTYMMKASWNLISPPSTLWKTLVRAKYSVGPDGFPKIDPSKLGSNYWKGISSNWDTFRNNLR